MLERVLVLKIVDWGWCVFLFIFWLLRFFLKSEPLEGERDLIKLLVCLFELCRVGVEF